VLECEEAAAAALELELLLTALRERLCPLLGDDAGDADVVVFVVVADVMPELSGVLLSTLLRLCV
jgi:hypothetical protein